MEKLVVGLVFIIIFIVVFRDVFVWILCFGFYVLGFMFWVLWDGFVFFQ